MIDVMYKIMRPELTVKAGRTTLQMNCSTGFKVNPEPSSLFSGTYTCLLEDLMLLHLAACKKPPHIFLSTKIKLCSLLRASLGDTIQISLLSGLAMAAAPSSALVAQPAAALVAAY
jgi:hypothetical protein